MSRALKCALVVGLFVLTATPAMSKDWLGSYTGAVIPGYEVKASEGQKLGFVPCCS